MLTEDEAAAYFPALAAELRLHGMLCPGAWFASQEEVEAMAAEGGGVTASTFPTVDASAALLKRAGWSRRDARTAPGWLVPGCHGP